MRVDVNRDLYARREVALIVYSSSSSRHGGLIIFGFIRSTDSTFLGVFAYKTSILTPFARGMFAAALREVDISKKKKKSDRIAYFGFSCPAFLARLGCAQTGVLRSSVENARGWI